MQNLQENRKFLQCTIENLKIGPVDQQTKSKLNKLEQILGWINNEKVLSDSVLNKCERFIKVMKNQCKPRKKRNPVSTLKNGDEICLLSSDDDDDDDVEFVSVTIVPKNTKKKLEEDKIERNLNIPYSIDISDDSDSSIDDGDDDYLISEESELSNDQNKTTRTLDISMRNCNISSIGNENKAYCEIVDKEDNNNISDFNIQTHSITKSKFSSSKAAESQPTPCVSASVQIPQLIAPQLKNTLNSKDSGNVVSDSKVSRAIHEQCLQKPNVAPFVNIHTVPKIQEAGQILEFPSVENNYIPTLLEISCSTTPTKQSNLIMPTKHIMPLTHITPIVTVAPVRPPISLGIPTKPITPIIPISSILINKCELFGSSGNEVTNCVSYVEYSNKLKTDLINMKINLEEKANMDIQKLTDLNTKKNSLRYKDVNDMNKHQNQEEKLESDPKQTEKAICSNQDSNCNASDKRTEICDRNVKIAEELQIENDILNYANKRKIRIAHEKAKQKEKGEKLANTIGKNVEKDDINNSSNLKHDKPKMTRLEKLTLTLQKKDVKQNGISNWFKNSRIKKHPHYTIKRNRDFARQLAENPVPTDKLLKKVNFDKLRADTNKIKTKETVVKDNSSKITENSENEAALISSPSTKIANNSEKIHNNTNEGNASQKKIEVFKLVKEKFVNGQEIYMTIEKVLSNMDQVKVVPKNQDFLPNKIEKRKNLDEALQSESKKSPKIVPINNANRNRSLESRVSKRDISDAFIVNPTELPRNINSEHYFKNPLLAKCLFCEKRPKSLSGHYLTLHKTEVFNSRLSPNEIKEIEENPIVSDIFYEHKFERIKVPCFFCKLLIFGTITNVIRHYSTHTGEFSFKCSLCPFSKPYRKEIATHCQRNKLCRSGQPQLFYSYDTKVNSITLHLCNICNYIQINKANIDKHLHTEHFIHKSVPHNIRPLIVVKINKLNNNSKLLTPEVNSKPEVNIEETALIATPSSLSPKALNTTISNTAVIDQNGVTNIESRDNPNDENKINKILEIKMNSNAVEVPRPIKMNELKPDVKEIQKLLGLTCNDDNCDVKLRRLIAFFKCMIDNCVFATNSSKAMIDHLQNHQQNENVEIHCSYCDIRTYNASALVKHIGASHGLSLLQCNKCLYRSCSATNVRIHKQKEHPASQDFAIYACNQHDSSIEPSNECLCACRCLDCDSKFGTFQKLDDHIKMCHMGPLNRSIIETHFACIYCFFSSEDLQKIREHLSEKHPHLPMVTCENFKIVNTANPRVNPINSTIIKDLNQNESRFLRPSLFSEADLNIIESKKSVIVIPKYVEHPNIFKCGFELCDFIGENWTQFESHCEKHSTGVYLCPHCQYEEKSKENLFKNIKSHIERHEASIMYCCGDCNYYHGQKQQTLVHFQDEHYSSESKLITINRTKSKMLCNIELILPPKRKYIQTLSSCFVCSTTFDEIAMDSETFDREIKSHLWEMHQIKILYICDFCHDDNYTLDLDSIESHIQEVHHKSLHRIHCKFFSDDCHFEIQSLNPLKILLTRKKHPGKSSTISKYPQIKLGPPIEIGELIIKEESSESYHCLFCYKVFYTLESVNCHQKDCQKKVTYYNDSSLYADSEPMDTTIDQLTQSSVAIASQDTKIDLTCFFMCFYCYKKCTSIVDLMIHFNETHYLEFSFYKNRKKLYERSENEDSSVCAYCNYINTFENPIDYHKLHFAFYFGIQKTVPNSPNDHEVDINTIKERLQKDLEVSNINLYQISRSNRLKCILEAGANSDSSLCLAVTYPEICQHLNNNIEITNFTNVISTNVQKILYGCDICKLLSFSEEEMIVHYREHVMPYICKCHYEFVDVPSLQEHIGTAHNGNILPTEKCLYRTQISLVEEYLKIRVIFENGVTAAKSELYGTVHCNNEQLTEMLTKIDDTEFYYSFSKVPYIGI